MGPGLIMLAGVVFVALLAWDAFRRYLARDTADIAQRFGARCDDQSEMIEAHRHAIEVLQNEVATLKRAAATSSPIRLRRGM